MSTFRKALAAVAFVELWVAMTAFVFVIVLTMVQVGYRLVPELTVAARASYEGRTIQHAGPGAGAGVTYSW